jgi:hypothetical protein
MSSDAFWDPPWGEIALEAGKPGIDRITTPCAGKLRGWRDIAIQKM